MEGADKPNAINPRSPSHGWILPSHLGSCENHQIDQENLTDGLTHEMIWMEAD